MVGWNTVAQSDRIASWAPRARVSRSGGFSSAWKTSPFALPSPAPVDGIVLCPRFFFELATELALAVALPTMNADPELCCLDAVQARERFGERSLSSVELVTSLVAHIEDVEPKVNAFTRRHAGLG